MLVSPKMTEVNHNTPTFLYRGFEIPWCTWGRGSNHEGEGEQHAQIRFNAAKSNLHLLELLPHWCFECCIYFSFARLKPSLSQTSGIHLKALCQRWSSLKMFLTVMKEERRWAQRAGRVWTSKVISLVISNWFKYIHLSYQSEENTADTLNHFFKTVLWLCFPLNEQRLYNVRR